MNDVSEDDLEYAVARLANRSQDPVDEQLRAATAAALFGETPEPVTIDRFVISRSLGSGAMGRVYRARDPDLDRDVAVKLLHRRSPEANRRILAEARTLARLNHPNIVTIFESGLHRGAPFIAMEYVAGASLEQRLGSKPLPWKTLAPWFLAAGRGLAAAHREKVVHRDFKPSNVLVGDDGRVRVADFGLAHIAEGPAPEEIEHKHASGAMGPHPNQRCGGGTPAYMPPQQWRHAPADPKMDQFAFCVALVRGLTGRLPFSGDDEVREAQIARGLAHTEPHIPRWLAKILRRGLAHHPSQRFASMEELIGALERHRVQTRNRIIGFATLLTATLAFGAGRSFSTPNPCEALRATTLELWSPARAQGVRAALIGPSNASPLFEQASAAAKSYVGKLADARADACAATWVRHEQSNDLLDRRMQCLGRRQAGLEAALATLNRGSAEAIEQMPDLIAELPPLASCENPELLSLTPALPESPTDRDAILSLWRQVDEATADLNTGISIDRERTAHADQLVAAAEALEHPPLLVDALMLQATVRFSAAQWANAYELFERALWQAESLRLDDPAGDAALRLARVCARDPARQDEALVWANHARAAYRRAMHPDGLTGELARVMGSIVSARGDSAQAVEWARRAVELSASSLSNVRARRDLAAAYDDAGQREAAGHEFQSALDEALETFGPHHDAVAVLQLDVGTWLTFEGRAEEAIGPLERAAETFERTAGHPHKKLAAQGALANAFEALGRTEDAARLSEAMLRQLERLYDDEHEMVRGARINLGNQLASLGDHAAAERLCATALLRERGVLAPHRTNVQAAACHANALLAQTRGHEAREQITALLEAVGPQGAQADRALLRFTLAQILHQIGASPEEIAPILREATIDYRSNLGLEPGELSPPERWWAEVQPAK